MNKILKYSLWTIGGIVGVTAAGAGYLAATFNPNDYKDRVIQAVKDSKQRDLHLDGDIKLMFFPSIGVSLSKVSLSEFKSPQPFAAIDSASVSLAVMPLLQKNIVVDEVVLNGLQATLIKHADGTTNIDDLLKKAPNQAATKSAPVKFDIASVTINKTNLSYVDEGSGAKYALQDFKLQTGRIAEGVPSKIALSLGVQANQPKVNVNATLNGTLTFDLEKQLFQLAGMELQATGSALDISDLKLKVGGDAHADVPRKDYGVKQFNLSVSGVKVKDAFEATLDAPALGMNDKQFTGDKLMLNAKMDGAMGKIVAALSMPSVESDPLSFKVSDLALDLDVQQADQAFKIKLSSPLSGNIQEQQFNLSNLVIALNATGDKFPGKSISSEMKGSVQANALKQTVQVALAGGLLQSQIKAKIGVANFANPAINFDIELDQLDADLYLPKKAADAPKTTTPEQPFDLSALRKLNLNGSLRIGALKVANVKSKNVRIDVKANQGLVNISPLSANLYDGSVNGSVSVDASQATPSFAIRQSLVGINVAALTKDAADFDTLEGKGNVNLDVTTQGDRVSVLKKALNGSMSLNLADGAIRGFNVAKKIRDAKSSLGSSTSSANKEEKTDFSELKASFSIRQGVAHNEDLSLKSPLIRLGGIGDINVGNDSMNYLAKATIARTLEGQGGKDQVGGLTIPLRISGAFTDLKYNLDFSSMVSDNAKQEIAAKKAEVQQQVQQKVDAQKAAAQQQVDIKKEEAKTKLQTGLRGLFK
ncbi:MAG: AsmA family protein [Gallionella sp.]|nr:AsmA family protein [Gallionella sp.]MDD4958595.1 AsmA family protein [Gallionella sp.]